MDAQLKPVLYVNDALLQPNIQGTYALFGAQLCPLCTSAVQFRLAVANKMTVRLADMLADDLNAIVYCLCAYIIALLKRKQSNDCNCFSRMQFLWDAQYAPTCSSSDVDYKLYQSNTIAFELTYCRLLLAQCLFVSAHRNAQSSDYRNCTAMLVHLIGVLRAAEQAAAHDGQTKTVTTHFLNAMRGYVSGYMLLAIIRSKMSISMYDKSALEIMQAMAQRTTQLLQQAIQTLTSNKIIGSSDNLLTFYQWGAVKASAVHLYFAARRLYVPMAECQGSMHGISMPNECGKAIAVLREAVARTDKFNSWRPTFPTAIKEDATAILAVLQSLLKQATDDNNKVKGDTIPPYSEMLLPIANISLIEKVTQSLESNENLPKLRDAFASSAPTSLPNYSAPLSPMQTALSTMADTSQLTLTSTNPQPLQYPVDNNINISGSTTSSAVVPAPTSLTSQISSLAATPTYTQPTAIISVQELTSAYTNTFMASVLRRIGFPAAFVQNEQQYQAVRAEERGYISKWAANIDSSMEQLRSMKAQTAGLVATFTGRDDMIYAYNTALLLDESVAKEAQQCKVRIGMYLQTPQQFSLSGEANKFHAMFMMMEAGHYEVFSELLQFYMRSPAAKVTLLDEISMGLSNLLKAVEFYQTFLAAITQLPTYGNAQ